jgi:general L-amino acid transport system permease protein
MTAIDREPALRQQEKPPPWRDVRILRVVAQVLFLLLVVVLVSYLYGNFMTNARRTGLTTTFDFLNRPAGVDIRDSTFRPSQPVRDALGVGLVNTIRVSIVGIALATILGILVGVGRLSTNWLVRKSAAVYVETFRNIPVVMWIIFIYTAVVLKLPAVTDAAEYLGLTVFSNRGVVIPWGEGSGNVNALLAALAVAFVLAVGVGVWRTKRFDATGEPHHRILWGTGVVLLIGAGAYVALGAPVTPTVPVRDGRVVTGGIQLGPEYAALLIALVLYTASHIAEIVRGSIQAVPKGQTEAAYSIALTGFQRLRFIVLPQAFRIMVPPLANQYLNLTKNSSLAVFIAYFELFRVTQQAIANGNPAPQLIFILMGSYLALSLTISLFANIVNRSLALESR